MLMEPMETEIEEFKTEKERVQNLLTLAKVYVPEDYPSVENLILAAYIKGKSDGIQYCGERIRGEPCTE